MKDKKSIALIAGSGKFPILLAKAAKANSIDLVIIGLNSEADKALEDLACKVYWVDLGQGARLLEILKNEQIQHAMLAGKARVVSPDDGDCQ